MSAVKLTKADNDQCSCAEVLGENPRYKVHGVERVIVRLRDHYMGKTNDPQAAREAADLLESLWDDAALAQEQTP